MTFILSRPFFNLCSNLHVKLVRGRTISLCVVFHVVQVTGCVAMIWMMMMIRYAKHNSPVYRSELGCVLKCTEREGRKNASAELRALRGWWLCICMFCSNSVLGIIVKQGSQFALSDQLVAMDVIVQPI